MNLPSLLEHDAFSTTRGPLSGLLGTASPTNAPNEETMTMTMPPVDTGSMPAFGRRSSFYQARTMRSQPFSPQDMLSEDHFSPRSLPASSPMVLEARSGHDLSERSPSPHARGPPPGALAEAMAATKSPGIIRRISRGAHNKLRRRASTTHSMRMRDQSAGPVLVRRRSDSIEGFDAGQDVSDLDLDNPDDLGEDVPEVPLIPDTILERDRNNALGISLGRASNASSTVANVFEGGIAPASSAVLECGTWLTKVTKRHRKRIKLWLDPNSARVCWHSTKASKSFFIDDVREYRIGAQSRNARDDVEIAHEQENLWVTIVYDTSERSQGRSIKTMHVLMPDDFILKLWTDALDTVSRQRIEIMNALAASPEKNEKSMALAWRQAMGRTGQVKESGFSLDDARWLCRKLEINCTDSAVRTHFCTVVQDENATLNYELYKEFVQSFRERKDIQHLYRNLQFGTEIGMDLKTFLEFLRVEQKLDVTKDPAYWEGIFEKYARSSLPRNGQPDSQSIGGQLVIGTQGFQNFLMSTHNSPLVPKVIDPTLDRPLNEYFISSSHNTYLLGRQVRGTSSVEGYIAALVKGCRCIEIDCWDGENGRPMVTHGRTMTTKIPFEDCVSVIAKYAFNSSQYPLIVSLEVHCNPEQQLVMVDLMKKYFKEAMVTEPINPSSTSLPSPQELKNRILIKVKASSLEELDINSANETFYGRSRARSLNSGLARASSSDYQSSNASPLVLSPTATSPSDNYPLMTPRGSSTTSGPTMTPFSSADDSDEIPLSSEKSRTRKTSRITLPLGKLGVYTQGIKFHGFQAPNAKTYNHIYSFAETTFDKLCTKKTDNKVLLESHNMRHLMRVYPSNMRVDSSNFNPLRSWRRGVQMAALNWQNFDVSQQINEAMFAAGSDRSGYVLKPDDLRHAKHLPIADAFPDAIAKKGKRGRKLVKFTVDIISAQRLPRPRTQNAEAGMNPYIEFEMFSAEDKARGSTGGESSSDALVRDSTNGVASPLRKRTRVVEGNGFDPQYYETITMAVETKFPSLIFVRWTVWNAPEGKTSSSNPPLLATFTAKLSSLQHGYRHLPLFNAHGEQYRDAKLFVRLTKEAPVAVDRNDSFHGIYEPHASPRPDPVRSGRSWPMRIFTRNPSQRKKDRTPGDTVDSLSRTSSLERTSNRSTASEER